MIPGPAYVTPDAHLVDKLLAASPELGGERGDLLLAQRDVAQLQSQGAFGNSDFLEDIIVTPALPPQFPRPLLFLKLHVPGGLLAQEKRYKNSTQIARSLSTFR